jgi:hypothetical protein
MAKKYIILLLCVVLILSGGMVSANVFSYSKVEGSSKATEKVSKFPSGSEVIAAELHESNLGPTEGAIFYFDMDLSEQRETVANILNWLNGDKVQLSEGALQSFYGFGGYNPTFIKLRFKDGRTYDIKTDEQNIVINGYYKDKSLIVSNCTDLVQFINTGWKSSKQKMTLMFYDISDVVAAEILPPVGKTMHKSGDSSYYVFDLSKAEQRNIIVNLLDWLNPINNDISQLTERLEPPKAGILDTMLQIKLTNGKEIIIYVDQLEKKIIINGQYIDKSIVIKEQDCPQLVQFLYSDWEKIKKDMVQKIY